MGKCFIGIDLGGTNIKFGIFDGDLKLVSKASAATFADMGPDAVVETIGKNIERLLKKLGFGADDIISIGMGSPGPAKYREGIIIKSTNMPKFVNVPIAKMVSERLERKPIFFENDANAACFGEYTSGAGKGVRDMVFFTLGTGVGGGIIHDGKLVRGCGDNGAELGHMIVFPGGRLCNCGQRGCVEAYASASNIAKRATEAIDSGSYSSLRKVLEEKGAITSEDVYEHLGFGDELAKEVTEKAAEALGIICVNMLHATEPKRIVFGGGMIGAGDVLLERIKYYFKKYVWNLKEEKTEICFAVLGEDAGIIGAAMLARELEKRN